MELVRCKRVVTLEHPRGQCKQFASVHVASVHVASVLVVSVLLAAACSSTKDTSEMQQRPPQPSGATGTVARDAPFDGVAAAIERGEAPKTTSVLVMRRGEIVYERYFNGSSADALQDARSVGKSITALAVGVAIEKGLLPGVDAKALPYLADLAPFAHDGPLKQGITIADLLTMSSAFACNDDDPKSVGNEENMYPKERWARWAVDLPIEAGYARDASGRGPWRYCTAGTFLLGQIVQRAAKQPADAFIAKNVLGPLGITRWEFMRSSSGEVQTGGQLRLRTRDFATIMEMVRNRGTHAGKQVVPAAYVDAALSPHRHAFAEQDYGYLFWHRTLHTSCGDFPSWFMSGNGGNHVIAIPKLEAIVVVTRTFYNQRGKMHQQTTALVEQQIVPGLCSERR